MTTDREYLTQNRPLRTKKTTQIRSSNHIFHKKCCSKTLNSDLPDWSEVSFSLLSPLIGVPEGEHSGVPWDTPAASH